MPIICQINIYEQLFSQGSITQLVSHLQISAHSFRPWSHIRGPLAHLAWMLTIVMRYVRARGEAGPQREHVKMVELPVL